MPLTLTATATDPTGSPTATAVADNDVGNAANLNSASQMLLNFIAWLRQFCALKNMAGGVITNLGTPVNAGDSVPKSYVDGKALPAWDSSGIALQTGWTKNTDAAILHLGDQFTGLMGLRGQFTAGTGAGTFIASLSAAYTGTPREVVLTDITAGVLVPAVINSGGLSLLSAPTVGHVYACTNLCLFSY